MLEQIAAIVTLTAALMTSGMDTAMPDKNVEGTYFLVNRTHRIVSAYGPETVNTPVSGYGRLLRADASAALTEMFQAAKEEAKIKLSTVSGYRSYAKQASIYNRKVQNTGSTAAANRSVAPPGASEHQLGLAMDLGAKGASGLNEKFGKTPGGKWTAENAHRFGFIVRYPKDYEDVTGYRYEPWHVRYVGVENATRIFQSGLPMEYDVSAVRRDLYLSLLQTPYQEVLP